MRKTGLCLFAALLTSHAYAGDNQTWTNYQGNAAHTGYVNATVNVDAIKPLWTRDIPIPENGNVYMGRLTVTKNALYVRVETDIQGTSIQLQVWAMNPATGETTWKNDFLAGNVVSNLTYADNKIYLFQAAHPAAKRAFVSNISIEAYDANTGAVKFSAPVTLNDGDWTTQAPVIDNNQLLIGSYTQLLSANVADGKMQWKSGDVYGNDITATLNHDYVFRSMNDAVAVLDRRTGKLLSTIGVGNNSGNLMANTLVWDEKHGLLFGALYSDDQKSGQLFAVDPAKQQVMWRLPMKNFFKQPVVADDVLYVVNQESPWYQTPHDSSLYAINTVTGNILWSYTLAQHVEAAPIVTNNAIILQTDVDIEFISRDKHELMKSIPIIGSGDLAVANNVLYYTENAFNDDYSETQKVSALAIG